MLTLLRVAAAIVVGLVSTAVATVNATAQDYPARPVTMIVPFPAGGATDTLARFLAEQMRPILGQTVIIENVGGAAGSIGVGRAVRSPADGYTPSRLRLFSLFIESRPSASASRISNSVIDCSNIRPSV